jgi:hypothetical protein
MQITTDPVHKTITFTQPNLIQQIISDVGLATSSNGKDTSVESVLYADKSGQVCQENWNYRSVIGKLNYLANKTWPDISMAVHQCAFYCSGPKALHELVVKCIARYLLRMQDKGLIFKPTMDLSLNMFMQILLVDGIKNILNFEIVFYCALGLSSCFVVVLLFRVVSSKVKLHCL